MSHLLVFTFHGFEIGCYVITANVQDPGQVSLIPSAPYERPQHRRRDAWEKYTETTKREEWVIPGERPVR